MNNKILLDMIWNGCLFYSGFLICWLLLKIERKKMVKVDLNFEAVDRIANALESIDARLGQLVSILTPQQASVIWFYIEDESGNLRRIKSMDLKVTGKAKLSIKPVDQFGNEAKLEEGSIAWSSTNPALGSFEVADDGKSAIFTPAGQVGDCDLQVSGDADLGEGVKALTGSLPVSLQPGDAVDIQLSAELL